MHWSPAGQPDPKGSPTPRDACPAPQLPLIRVKVAERSMEPALRPGDWLLVRRTRRIRPGQIVLARHPDRPDMFLVKRAARRMPDGRWWLSSDNPGPDGGRQPPVRRGR